MKQPPRIDFLDNTKPMEAAALTPLPSTAKRLCLHLGSTVAAATGQHASNEDATTLSTDVIFEILSWMPARSLCRFRCMSRPWHALISDPAFVAAHGSRAEPLLVGSFCLGASLQLMDTDGTVARSMAGVDGCWMLCTSLDSLACFTDEHSPHPQVIDLATGEMLLTRPELHEGGAHGFGYYLDAQRYGFGFGRAASSRVYKVVRLTEDRYHNGMTCKSEAWDKTIKGPWEANFHDLSETTRNVNIAELNGALCMAQTKVHAPDGYSYTDIWLLDDSDKNIWSKTYTIHMDRAVDLVKPLRMMRDGGKLLFYYSEDNSPPGMQMYDPP
ncbi:unnamed protein product [Alopecurus aequalis]